MSNRLAGERGFHILLSNFENRTVSKNGIVDEKYVLYSFPVVSLFEEHTNIYDVGNLEHLQTLSVRTNDIVSHITVMHFLK